jgi:hypothetical protein
MSYDDLEDITSDNKCCMQVRKPNQKELYIRHMSCPVELEEDLQVTG